MTPASSTLVIDFSSMQHTDKHPSFHSEAEQLINWVKTYSKRHRIHVYMRSGITSVSNRKLQSTLQSLGCRVTARTSFASLVK